MLLWRSKPDPNVIRGQPVDLIDDIRLGVALQNSIRQAAAVKAANELQSCVALPENLANASTTFFRASEQIVSRSLRNRFQKLAHEGRPVNTVLEACPSAI